MSDHDVRAGIQQAKQGELGISIMAVEAAAFAAVAGLAAHSWGVAILAFVAVATLAPVVARKPRAASLVSLLIGAGWAALAYAGATAADASPGTVAGLVLLAGLLGVSGNWLAFEFIRDINRRRG